MAPQSLVAFLRPSYLRWAMCLVTASGMCRADTCHFQVKEFKKQGFLLYSPSPHLLSGCRRLQGLWGEERHTIAGSWSLNHYVENCLMTRNPFIGWLPEQEINLYCVKSLRFGDFVFTVASVPLTSTTTYW